MQRQSSKSKTLVDENPFSLSLGDLMAGLLLIFVLLLSFVMLRLGEDVVDIRELKKELQKISTEYASKRDKLYEDLKCEFQNDLEKWNAVLDREKLSVRFREPKVLFEQGKAEVKLRFKEILDNFFPRYISTLINSEYVNEIVEIRIEGHTSSEWSDTSEEDAFIAYILNMKLSQDRTRRVLEYVIQIPAVNSNRDWTQERLTANGLSSSKLILNPDGTENRKESRRVEFRVRTDAEKQLEKIKEKIKELEQFFGDKP